MILTQVISVAVAVLAIVWHQHRSIDRLRAELRSEFRNEIGTLRNEIAELRNDLIDVRERLARIEGYLRIGIPAEAIAATAGAGSAGGERQA